MERDECEMVRDKYVNGLYFWAPFKDSNILEAMNYKPLDEDIFIATYPKSGTTLMQNLVFLLKNKGEYPINFNLRDYVPFIDIEGLKCLEKLSRPRLLKTHLPFDKMVFNENAKYIFICRNPFDVCNSFYYHKKMMPAAYDFHGSFDEFFNRFIEGKVDFGNYFDHLNGWFTERNRENILFLTYEGLIEDLRGAVKRIGSFLGGEFLKNSNEDAIVDSVVQKCSISSMKAMEKSFQPDIVKQGSSFIRKGVKGDYTTIMSKEQIDTLSKLFNEKCGDSGANKIWKDKSI